MVGAKSKGKRKRIVSTSKCSKLAMFMRVDSFRISLHKGLPLPFSVEEDINDDQEEDIKNKYY